MSKVRGIRFTEKEESLVEEFLKGNPFLDFTTLAKIAIPAAATTERRVATVVCFLIMALFLAV